MTARTRPYDVVAAVPAHNEAARIVACLHSICDALDVARADGLVRHARIAIAAHRCLDDTADIARHTLNNRDVDHIVIGFDDELAVGVVRTRLAEHAVARRAGLDPDRLWLFSTDADSIVPHDWISGLLAAAEHAHADLVVGMVDLVGWRASPGARRRYQRIIINKLRPDGGHDHVYAANLAIRWTTFQSLQGFPGVTHGEEAVLVQRAQAAGVPIATPRTPRVQTSGRTTGRASHGLAALLQQLG